MFCPQCKTDYRPAFTRCADCGVDLVEIIREVVESRPPEEAGQYTRKGLLFYRARV